MRSNEQRRRLTRSRSGMLGGVAAGLADYFDLDPTLVRLGFVVALLFSGGTALLLYFLLWLIMPQSESAAGPAERGDGRGAGLLLIGALFILVGLMFFFGTVGFMRGGWGFGTFFFSWPLLLVVAGVVLLLLNRDRGRS